jgi:hypothetical protein
LKIAPVAVAVLLVAGPVARADSGTRLYTNADLDRLGPAPAEPSRPIAQPELGWDFVQGFIDGQYARIYAERDRQSVASVDDQRFNERFHGSLAYAPFLGAFRSGRRDLSHGIQRAIRKDLGKHDRRLAGSMHPRSNRRP